jgi:ketosteroid isomerase-like protein
MLINLKCPSNYFAQSKQPLRARTGRIGSTVYKESPLLQMNRHLRISTLRRAGFVGPLAVALFHSALILFGATSAWSVSAAPVGKEQDDASSVAQIRSVLRAQQDAWNRGDIDGFMNGYARSKSTIFISEDTVKRGWETVHDRYRKKYSDRAKMGVLTFSDLEITPLAPDSAVVLGRWKLQRAKDRPHGLFTLIFRRLPEGWRIVLDHTSAAAPPQ